MATKKVARLQPGDHVLSFPGRTNPKLYAGVVELTIAQGDDADTFEVHQHNGAFRAPGNAEVEVGPRDEEEAS